MVLWPKVRSANQEFEDQNYDVAIAKYDYLTHSHPSNDKRQFFIMQQGLAFYLIQSYHDAEKVFHNYLRRHPEGLYKSQAETYLTKIEALRSQKRRNYVLQRKQIKGDIKLLREMLKRDPYNAQVHYDLANKLWELGKYNEAASHYLKAGDINAALQENELLKNRLMIDEQGEVVPVTPERQRELEREQNPLIVFDIHSYKQRIKPDYLGASKAFQTVAGKVRNQSKRVHRGVYVSVNFYNMHHELLDTQSYYVGAMAPNEVRAFLVKGQNYDNIYNIDHFECTARYQ